MSQFLPSLPFLERSTPDTTRLLRYQSFYILISGNARSSFVQLNQPVCWCTSQDTSCSARLDAMRSSSGVISCGKHVLKALVMFSKCIVLVCHVLRCLSSRRASANVSRLAARDRRVRIGEGVEGGVSGLGRRFVGTGWRCFVSQH